MEGRFSLHERNDDPDALGPTLVSAFCGFQEVSESAGDLPLALMLACGAVFALGWDGTTKTTFLEFEDTANDHGNNYWV